MNKKLNILLLSSISPYKSANLGLDVIKSLEQAGHRVDFLSKYRFDGMLPRMYSIYDSYEPVPKLSLRSRLKMKYPFLGYLNPANYFRRQNKNKYIIIDRIEEKPPVDVDQIIHKIDEIQSEYDLVITLFLHRMVTAKTLKCVYDKLQCPIFINAVDMYPLTGGCIYFWDCRGLQTACGKCPGLNSNNKDDQTHKNFLLKKEVYASIECIYIGNSWMCEWARKTGLFDPTRIKKGGIVINQEVFLDRDKREARGLLGFPISGKFILFAGATSLTGKRKGGDVLVKSVNIFLEKLPPEEREQVILVLAGKNVNQIRKYFPMEVRDMGFMEVSKLALVYAAADVYLSTTVEDAGPSMVNQALMCGTPVVAFETGIALDIVETDVTGYRAKCRDIDDYSYGIRHLYQMGIEKKMQMSRKCREVAMQESSYTSFAARIRQIYEELE